MDLWLHTECKAISSQIKVKEPKHKRFKELVVISDWREMFLGFLMVCHRRANCRNHVPETSLMLEHWVIYWQEPGWIRAFSFLSATLGVWRSLDRRVTISGEIIPIIWVLHTLEGGRDWLCFLFPEHPCLFHSAFISTVSQAEICLSGKCVPYPLFLPSAEW